MNGLNALPVFGWLLAAIMSFLIAIPIFFLWRWLAPIYFGFLPGEWTSIPFHHTVGMIWLLMSLRGIMTTPISVSVEREEKRR